jgi:hypothetical protein
MKANKKASSLVKTDFFKSLGWRVLIGFVLLYLAVWLTSLFLGVGPNMLLRALSVPEQLRLVISGTISRGGMIVVTVLFSIWMFQRVTRLDADEYFFPICPGWWQDLLAGLGLGLFAILSIFAIEIGLGWLRLEGWALQGKTWGEALGAIWMVLLANGLAAIGEEAIFRGYFLTGLKKAWGSWIGLLVMSVPFGAMHLLVSGASETHWALFTLMLTLPGLILGWAYLRSGTLWLPMGIHFAWNLFQVDVFNLTGEAGQHMIGLTAEKNGPDWFMGTSYRIEVGAAGLIGLLIVTLGVWVWTGLSPGHLTR